MAQTAREYWNSLTILERRCLIAAESPDANRALLSQSDFALQTNAVKGRVFDILKERLGAQ